MKEKIINFENSFNLNESIKKDEILDINQINKNDYITNIDIQNTNIEKINLMILIGNNMLIIMKIYRKLVLIMKKGIKTLEGLGYERRKKL